MGSNNIPWTNNEIEILKETYAKNSAQYCSTLLPNRTLTAIRRKANILKLGRTNNFTNYDYVTFSLIVSNSKSIKDILKTLNLRSAGGNFATIQQYIKKYNLDTTHFDDPAQIRLNALRSVQKDLTIDVLFCENSTISRATIKKYLFKYNLKQNICELCGQNDTWFGKKITLILDHINGVHNDNRLSNLRIVCPNCNATLDTHCGKNK